MKWWDFTFTNVAEQFDFTYRKHRLCIVLYTPDLENNVIQMDLEPEIKDTTKTNTSASYFDLLLCSGGCQIRIPPLRPT